MLPRVVRGPRVFGDTLEPFTKRLFLTTALFGSCLVAPQVAHSQSDPVFTAYDSYHTYTSTTTTAQAFGDFDGDSCIDAMIGHYGSPIGTPVKSIRFMKNDCGGLLSHSTWLATNITFDPTHGDEAIWDMVAMDINNDQKQDVVALAGLWTTGQYSIATILSQGNGNFAPAVHTSLNAAVSRQRILKGIFNADARADIAAFNDSGIVLYRSLSTPNQTTGYFELLENIPVVCDGPIIGTFNNDPFDDIACATPTGVTLILRSSSTGYQLVTVNNPVPPTNQVVMTNHAQGSGDFNGDMKKDFALLYRECTGGCVSKSMIILNTTPMNGAASYSFMPNAIVGTDGTFYSKNIAIHDINNDGRDDIAFPSGWGEAIRVQLSAANGLSQQSLQYSTCPGELENVEGTCLENSFEYTVHMEDLNNDGCRDLQSVAYEDDPLDHRLRVAQRGDCEGGATAGMTMETTPDTGFVNPTNNVNSSGIQVRRREIYFKFSSPVSNLTTSNFQVRYFRNGLEIPAAQADLAIAGAPQLTLVSGSGFGPYLLDVNPGIPVGSWMQIEVIGVVGAHGEQFAPGNNKVVFGAVPGDLNHDGRRTGIDVTNWLLHYQCHLAVNNCVHRYPTVGELKYVDISNNNTVGGEDPTMFIQLLNGYNTVVPANFNMGPMPE